MATLWSPLSVVTIATVGLTCKGLIRSGLCSTTVNGLDILKSVIDDEDRRTAGQGVVTGALNQEYGAVVGLIMQCAIIFQRAFQVYVVVVC